jgi:hypothetical protein
MTEAGTPLGVLHLQPWGGDGGSAPCPHEKESAKWQAGLESVAERLPEAVSAVIIQDREADFYQFFAAPRPERIDLLVRAAQERRVETQDKADGKEAQYLLSTAAAGPVLGEFRVTVPCASKDERQILPRQRVAVLEVRAVEVMIQPPSGSKAGSPPVKATLIHAQEVAPADAKPTDKSQSLISWTLITTMPVTGTRRRGDPSVGAGGCLQHHWLLRAPLAGAPRARTAPLHAEERVASRTRADR